MGIKNSDEYGGMLPSGNFPGKYNRSIVDQEYFTQLVNHASSSEAIIFSSRNHF